MRYQILIVGVLCVAVSGGCKKKAANQPAAGSGTPAPSACSPTAWKEPGGLLCVDAPGFTPGALEKNENMGPEDPQMRIYFKKPQDAGKPELMLQVSWFPKRDASTALATASNMESDYKNNKGEDKGKFTGDKGAYVVFARKDDNKAHQLYAVVQGNKHAYECECSSYDAPIAAELIAACKSVTPTD
jgi:hypothetical protein